MAEGWISLHRKFIEESNTFVGFNFTGQYIMPTEHYFKILEHYSITGENLLDAYSNFMHLTWEYDSEIMCNYREYNNKREDISSIRKLRIVDHHEIHRAIENLKNMLIRFQNAKQYEDNAPRRKANSITSKPEIRQAVYELHGNKCLCCGSQENICIDHVVPVYKGGKNEIENFQPLCKSCNSSKGTKIIDYRQNRNSNK
jgi:hypothetical protein